MRFDSGPERIVNTAVLIDDFFCSLIGLFREFPGIPVTGEFWQSGRGEIGIARSALRQLGDSVEVRIGSKEIIP